MSVFPALFISHGSPDLPLHPSPARDFLAQLGQQFDRPRAILVISAHWSTPYPLVNAASQTQTIHDFSGFPAALYRLNYPAPGAPDLAGRVVELLTAANIKSGLSNEHGLDHGAWNPLLLMYPDADVPVTQLSIQSHLDPAHHLAIGRALAPLRREGVLVLASGSATHNLWELQGHARGAAPPDWVAVFSRWLTQAVVEGETEMLLNYRRFAPYATRNHPTEEHLLPLFVALGAGGSPVKAIELHSSFNLGVLNMASYAFDLALSENS